MWGSEAHAREMEEPVDGETGPLADAAATERLGKGTGARIRYRALDRNRPMLVVSGILLGLGALILVVAASRLILPGQAEAFPFLGGITLLLPGLFGIRLWQSIRDRWSVAVCERGIEVLDDDGGSVGLIPWDRIRWIRVEGIRPPIRGQRGPFALFLLRKHRDVRLIGEVFGEANALPEGEDAVPEVFQVDGRRSGRFATPPLRIRGFAELVERWEPQLARIAGKRYMGERDWGVWEPDPPVSVRFARPPQLDG